MKNIQLEKGNKLKEDIDGLREFLEYIGDCKGGTFTIRKPKYLFRYKSWFKSEKTFELSERLAFRMLLEVDKELDDLNMQFESL